MLFKKINGIAFLKKYSFRGIFGRKVKSNRKTKDRAADIVAALEAGETIASIKKNICKNDSGDWNRCTSLVYSDFLKKQRKERKVSHKKRHVSTTSPSDMTEILKINSILADHALSMPILSNMGDLHALQQLINNLPTSEQSIIHLIGRITMQPRFRVMQKKGRIEHFDQFRLFTKMIDAATLSYYRTNFISCYLTLLPIVEGILIRWMGYTEGDKKPEFESIRVFFKTPHTRQPNPYNIEFHEIYSKACDRILNEHFYKPSTKGPAHSNFNRHVASHILNDNQFATRENCIRLFLLIDMMAEIHFLEAKTSDYRFALTHTEIAPEVTIYARAILDNLEERPEHILLDSVGGDVLSL